MMETTNLKETCVKELENMVDVTYNECESLINDNYFCYNCVPEVIETIGSYEDLNEEFDKLGEEVKEKFEDCDSKMNDYIENSKMNDQELIETRHHMIAYFYRERIKIEDYLLKKILKTIENYNELF